MLRRHFRRSSFNAAEGPRHSSLMGVLQAACLGFGLLPLPTLAQAFTLCGNATSLTVASTDDATALASALQCSNGEFYVQWVGEVVVEETVHVTNGTLLNITGTAGALADGDFKTRLFAVDGGSSLHLSDMTLIQGYASDGAAIYANGSSVSFSGMSSFTQNTVFYEDNFPPPPWYTSYTSSPSHSSYSSWEYSKDSTEPPYPSISGRGGAIHAVSSTLSWEGGEISFVENLAEYEGGAIWVWDSSVSFNGGKTCEFVGNAGSTEFIRGGAIFARGSRLSWERVGSTTFSNNAAEQGGAMYVEAANVTWEAGGGVGSTTFSNNSAFMEGGAMHVESSTVNWKAGETRFTNNSATSGGAISATDRGSYWATDSFGYGFYGYDDSGYDYSHYDDYSTYDDDSSTWTSSPTSSWTHYDDWTYDYSTWGTPSSTSSWTYDDDWTYADDDSTTSTTWSSSSASLAGFARSSIAWDGHMVFDNNKALRFDGGGVYLQGSDLEILEGGSAVFSQNVAETAGGGVYCTGAALTVSGQALFTNNTANSGAGVGLFGDSSLDFSGGNVTISGNVASSNGGGIHAEASTQFVVERATFLANFAGKTGGAMSLLSVGMAPTATSPTSQAAIVSGCRFVQNDASDAGGAVAVAGGLAKISDSEFDGNTAGKSHPAGNLKLVGARGRPFVDRRKTSVNGETIFFSAVSARCGVHVYDETIPVQL